MVIVGCIGVDCIIFNFATFKPFYSKMLNKFSGIQNLKLNFAIQIPKKGELPSLLLLMNIS